MQWINLCSFLSVFPFANPLSILLNYAIFCVRAGELTAKSNSPCQKLKVISLMRYLYFTAVFVIFKDVSNRKKSTNTQTKSTLAVTKMLLPFWFYELWKKLIYISRYYYTFPQFISQLNYGKEWYNYD